jgi:hypothetical protein
MVEWAVSGDEVYAVGRGETVRIAAPGWTQTAPDCQLPYPVDATLAGTAHGLELPPDVRLPDGEPVTEAERLPDGTHLLTVDATVETLVRVPGPATVEPGGDAVAVEFPDGGSVAFGFRSRNPGREPERVAVPRSPAGLAAAVTAAGATLPAGPERSHPVSRPHPPVVEYDEAPVPDVEPDSGIRFHLPDGLEYVLVAAPLAYYLGADVVVEDRDAPLLRADSGYEYPFGPLPAFATEVAAACRQVFHFDCLLRDCEFEATPDRGLLAELGLDADRLREAAPVVRYPAFLDVPPTAIEGELPVWPLSTYVDPTFERARSLPALLDRLSLVYPAEASEMDGRDLLERSLDDFYRGEVVSVDPIDPELGVGRVHAWLADGEPIDAFRTTTAAHEHRMTADPGETVDVTVVLNDEAMAEELAVAEVYRERTAALPGDVTVRRDLTRAELATVFETPTDFVHYVGHCEVGGLECRDGYLSADSLATSRARTFFLNACGSYREGEALVEQGSVAGAVTLDRVLDEPATTVGTAFGRLLVHGFGIERSLALARRRVMMGKDYAVVGDGTYGLTPPCGDPAVLRVEEADPGFEVAYAVHSARAAGRRYRDPFEGGEHLYGDETTARLTREQLAGLLRERSLPVVYEDDLRWSDELVAAVTSGTDGAHGS